MNQTLRNAVLKVPFSIPVYLLLKKTFYFLPLFLSEYLEFERQSKRQRARFSNKITDWSPKLLDRTSTTPFDPHYTYHPAWAARVVAQVRPEVHIDISSTLHFCTIVSAIVPVKFYDYRPATLKLSNLTSEPGDLLALPFADGSVKSISCMHVIEHVGLGRYGDRIDPDGDIKAIGELKRVLAPGGCLLFVVPVGKPKIDFNRHRIYSYEQIVEYFSDLELKEFSLIPDDASQGLISHADPALVSKQAWGCGCFWFTK
jgi:SAM-dependent methyltransferase